VTLLSTDTYEDVQYQNDASIGPQEPIPAGTHNIELSWDRQKGYMRVIIGGKKWWFKEYLGKAVVLNTDNERGRLNLRAVARLDGETLIMYRPPDATPHPLVQGLERERTHNRLCYRRPTRNWRLRDERMDWNHPDALKLVESFMGDMSAEWNASDPIAHIYHNGYVIIDDQHTAHLYDPDLNYEDM
jgi:hypothetical protein